MKTNFINDPFSLERYRAELVSKGEYKKLVTTYSRRLPEIKDINPGHFWNKKFLSKAGNEDGPMAEDRVKIVFNEIKRKQGKLLDIGFGIGGLEKKLARVNGIKVFGIDISEYAVKKARGNLRGEFRKSNVLKIPYEEEYFDFVIAMEVLEHILPSKIFIALNEIKRVLKGNGELIMSVPLNEGLEELIKRGVNPNGHVRIYTPELVFAELKISGF